MYNSCTNDFYIKIVEGLKTTYEGPFRGRKMAWKGKEMIRMSIRKEMRRRKGTCAHKKE